MFGANVKFYGDNVRWFIGTVTSINDPLQLGRVQIRIFGIHNNKEEIPMHSLPWAATVVPTTEEGVGGLGATVGIKPGAQVFGYFLDATNSQHPLILGSIPKIERPTVETEKGVGDPINKPTFLPSTYTDTEFLDGATNEEKIWNYFRSSVGGSWTPDQVAGLMGNFAIETNYQKFGTIDPTISQKGGPAFGIAQWEGPRKEFLLNNYVKDTTIQVAYSGGPYLLDSKSLWAQVTYVNYEFTHKESRAAKHLRNSTDVTSATNAVLDRYERPAGSEYSKVDGDPQRDARIKFANEFKNKFSKSGG